jgi:ABC-type branched-subunit amino acid transport system substrate-binding protein/tRNA A-37 threonylcarbamoyl transferase component Bud32
MLQYVLNNRYKTGQVLGEGSFGKTFLAEDTYLPSCRHCVIKQLKPVTNNPQIYKIVQDRFAREAAILEDLGNSNHQIPKLYAYFAEQDNFYLVQEYIEGKTLTNKVQTEGVMSESVVREILKNSLSVLNFVHSRHIIHRDIKPDNVMLRDSDNVPVLIDFGAVRESMGTVVNSQGLPTNSIIIGTPGFMPSEQAFGRAIYSSDLYSLGLTMIYLLTGKMPQELQTDPITGCLIWHQYAMNVSPGFQMVLDKAIACDPKVRYATAREMIDALESLNKPTIISPMLPKIAKQPLQKKHKLPPILYILLFCLMGGTYWFLTHKPPSNISKEFAQRRISSGDKILVTADATPQKQAGVQALAKGDEKTAIAQFSSSLQQHRNDPETLIYRNNAFVGKRKAYTIAVVVPIGSNLNVAQEILRGVAQAQDEINRHGGINGVWLRVIIVNDENDPKIARQIAELLSQNPEILGVVGHNSSTATLAAAPVYQRFGLVMITPTSAANQLMGIGDYIFRGLPSIRFTSDTLARQIVKHDHKTKIAVCFDAKAPENLSFRDAVISAIITEGGKVSNTVCDFSAPNFNPQTVVAEAIADGAEALLLNPHIDRFDPAIAVVQANKKRLTLYSSSTMYTKKTLQMGLADVNGLVLAVPWHPQSNSSHLFSVNASQLWGGQVNWRTAMAYDSAQAIVTALKQSHTREGLQKVLHSPGFSAIGAGDKIEFLPSGERMGGTVLVMVQPDGKSGYEFALLRQ